MSYMLRGHVLCIDWYEISIHLWKCILRLTFERCGTTEQTSRSLYNITSSRYVHELCVLWYKHEIWHKYRAHNYKKNLDTGHLRFRLGWRWRPFSKMAAVNLFSHIVKTNWSISVVLVHSKGCRGPPFEIYYFWPSPTLTSAIFLYGGCQD